MRDIRDIEVAVSLDGDIEVAVEIGGDTQKAGSSPTAPSGSTTLIAAIIPRTSGAISGVSGVTTIIEEAS